MSDEPSVERVPVMPRQRAELQGVRVQHRQLEETALARRGSDIDGIGLQFAEAATTLKSAD
ncbi:MAG: hypothetical protein KGJ30_07335 [Burkholderiales bacterium]|nr:hypothetical protein [Burkholderiales bacterium]MDE1927628.1 hypothetical protein [Burkholderiales bacterium]MDE2158719.1 hypothetical protein [Burkholderiales bacterium]